MSLHVIPASSVNLVTSIPSDTVSNTSRKFDNLISGKSNIVVDYTTKIVRAGDFDRVTGINALVTSLKNLLMTPLGGYPFDPEYGSLLYKKVWEPADNITAEEIRFEVDDRIRQFDDRINIENVDIAFFSDGKGFRVSVTIERDNKNETIDLDFNQDNAGFSLEEG